MRAAMALAALGAAGCSFLFDPAQIPDAPDLAASGVDLAGPPSTDLAAPDLSACTPPLFPGFADGGGTFDCTACGCVLDDFTNPAATAVRFSELQSATFPLAVGGGTLRLGGPTPANGEGAYIASAGRWTLAGDFDLLVDFSFDVVSNGGNLQLAVVGPTPDGGTNGVPTVVADEYRTSMGALTSFLYADGLAGSQPTSLTGGTLQVTRAGATMCAALAGANQLCRTGVSAVPVRLLLELSLSNAGCVSACSGATCCPTQVKLSNLRLRTGQLVSP